MRKIICCDMPLLIITGLPCSGKTTRAKELYDFIEQKIKTSEKYKLQLINDEFLHLNKESYKNAASEKICRAEAYSAVERYLSPDTIVISDFMNYIKGYRYQLSCQAKSLRTHHCVVHVTAPLEKCREWNKSAYSQELQEELIYRYEEPNPNVRWDSPLFTIFYNDTSLPYDEIWHALTNDSKVRPNNATIVKAPAATNYLTHLDEITTEINKLIMEIQAGNINKIPGVEIALPLEPLSIYQLGRLKRQFISLNRQLTAIPVESIKNRYVEYLNNNFM